MPFVAEAMLVTEPASRSAWVIVYDAVQVIDAPGARLAVAGHDSSVALSSVTVNGPANVTLPDVGHQIAVRDHVAQPRIRQVGVAVFTIDNAGSAPPSPSRCRSARSPCPFVAEATLVTEPASRSAWVIVYDAVQVIDAPGARLAVAGQDSSVALSSLTVNGPDNVTLPELVTR